MNLEETLAACKKHGFNEWITQETLWNEAYRLGRSRWYWGPMWWVDLMCRMKSKMYRELTLTEPLCPACNGYHGGHTCITKKRRTFLQVIKAWLNWR